MVMRAFDYNINPGQEPENPYKPPETPQNPYIPAPWLQRTRQTDEQMMANFDKLWKINPAFAFEFARLSDDQGGWFQRKMGDLRNRYAGGNVGSFNQMLNDSSYGIQNAYASYGGGRDAAIQMIMDMVNGKSNVDLTGFDPKAPVSPWRPAWDNPYNFGRPYGGGKDPWDFLEGGKGPSQHSDTPPPLPGQVGWDPNGGMVPNPTPITTPNPYNPPNMNNPVRPPPGQQTPGSTIPQNPFQPRPTPKNGVGAGGWNPYSGGWRQ